MLDDDNGFLARRDEVFSDAETTLLTAILERRLREMLEHERHRIEVNSRNAYGPVAGR